MSPSIDDIKLHSKVKEKLAFFIKSNIIKDLAKMIFINYQNTLSKNVGRKDGITPGELKKYLRIAPGIIRKINQKGTSGAFIFRKFPYQEKLLRDLEDLADDLHRRFKNFLHVGIGGSALGAIAIVDALAEKPSHRTYFLDNIDPEETSAILKELPLEDTLFHFASRSGNTTETLASFLIILKRLQDLGGKKYKENIIITTAQNGGSLRRFAKKEGIKTFEIPEETVGRFSVFTPVCLLPIAFAGIDLKRLLKGARIMDQLSSKEEPFENIPFLAALINFLLDKKGKSILVVMIYLEALKSTGEWFKQLWAESLGKRFSLKSKEIFSGQTPLISIGTTDQHSQIQLYNQGPNNKVIMFLETQNFREDIKLPYIFEGNKTYEIFQNRWLSELMKAAKKGTESSLSKNHRPNYTITLKEISPESMGALLFMFQMQTVFAAMLYEVNPFDQPGVDLGKRLMVKFLEKAPPES